MANTERKYCSKCQCNQKLERFEEGYKTCNTCREKAKRYQQKHKEDIRQQKREYRANNPEKVRELGRNHRNKIKDEMITCPVCKYEVKKYKKAQHEKSQTHQYYLRKLEDPDFEKDLSKPDLIKMVDGKEHYYCHACKLGMLACMWRSHCEKPYHKLKV